MFNTIKKWLIFKLVPEVFVTTCIEGTTDLNLNNESIISIRDIKVTRSSVIDIALSDANHSAIVADAIEKNKDSRVFILDEGGLNDYVLWDESTGDIVWYRLDSKKH